MENTLDKWVGKKFVSSAGLTAEFQSFHRAVKGFLKKELDNDFYFYVNRGHFYFSGFAQNKQTQKWAWFSSSDIRYFQDEWFNNLLVRTAKDNRDYTGGTNCSTCLPNIKNALINLTK
jgi:hypothetical protein